MNIRENISLKPFNTFGIDVRAKYFVSVSSVRELTDVLSLKAYPNKLILGGGSNILLTKPVDRLVIHIDIKGIEVISEDETTAFVKAYAGERWHTFVLWCIANDFGGVENLSLIPGNVGAAPIQNIGAYGVEVCDTLYVCEAISVSTKAPVIFKKSDCYFGYRTSIFKEQARGEYIITAVTFRLTKQHHKKQLNYGAIASQLKTMGIKNASLRDISEAIICIRKEKLPSPERLGNGGSFFKNPVISKTHYNTLLQNFSDMPGYPISEEAVKIPAGWLIETAGFKGKRFGCYGVHKDQALVLVNYGGANGLDILNLSKSIHKTVKRLFDISIEPEVNIL